MTWTRCDHSDNTIRYVEASGGKGRMYRRQCLVCGEGTGSWISKAAVLEEFPSLLMVPAWDRDLAEKWAEARRRVREEEQWGRVAWSYDRYRSYIATSPVWKNKRERVLERDNHLCQACRRAAAEQVHHLTYSHLFDEPLFELIAVCARCHKRLHDRLALAQAAAGVLNMAKESA